MTDLSTTRVDSTPGAGLSGAGGDSLGDLARQGDLTRLQALVTERPELRGAVDDALLGAGRFDGLYQLAQVNPAPARPAAAVQAAKPVPEAQVRAFQAGNDAAVRGLTAQRAELATFSAELKAKLATDLTASSARTARALDAKVDAQIAKVDRELDLRARAAAAIQASTAGAGKLGTDPAVAAPLAALAKDRTLPSARPLDLKPLEAQAAKLITYETPVWMRYGSGGGPAFVERPRTDPTNAMAGSQALADAVQAGRLSASEGRIVTQMSANEGRYDSVQAYDNQAVTAGAMQKTVAPNGTGELARQVYAFSQANPARYQALFADKGWTVAHTGKGDGPGDYTMSFRDVSDPKAQPITGAALVAYVKDAAHPENWAKALGPLQAAGRDPAFQAQQLTDFAARLRSAVDTRPAGYAQPISAYVTSEKAAALVLDESVNRPANVRTTFGAALDSFYAANPKADRDPAKWTAEQRAAYEPQILQAYGTARNATSMTDAAARFTNIQASSLSGDPGSFVRGTR